MLKIEIFKRWLLMVVLLLVSACGDLGQSAKPGATAEVWPSTQPLQNLPAGQWRKIHEQQAGDEVVFSRQHHGGSAFDSKRGRLVLFGSDTHGKDWTNSPLVFDVAKRRWLRVYEDDKPASYRVNSSGLPVAGEQGEHPWAMHTFGAVVYDAARDEIVISSYPQHMKPGRFSDALSAVWSDVKRHPTWMWNPANGNWQALEGRSVDFFPFAAAYDSRRGAVVGYRDSGVYALAGEPRRWQRVLSKGLLGYHNNAVYDTQNDKVVVMGSHKNSNDIIIYDPVTKQQNKMPTPGLRPPKDQHIPMAYHPGLSKTIALVDRIPAGVHWQQRERTTAETWVYDYKSDGWQQVVSATLPFGCGMNYNLEYDPGHEVLLLVSSEPGRATSVWALRL